MTSKYFCFVNEIDFTNKRGCHNFCFVNDIYFTNKRGCHNLLGVKCD